MILAAGLPAAAQDTGGQLATCARIFGAVERLACYDRLAHAYGAPANASTAVPPPMAAPSPVEQFGGESVAAPEPVRDARLDSIQSDIADFSLSPGGKFILTLANGQVWREIESERAVVTRRRSTRSATISRGAFGSYNLVFNDRAGFIKVVRVR